jgi:Flp pilus assembly CpaE family ATPase
MEAWVTSNDQSLSSILCNGLQTAGVECPPSRVVPHQSVIESLAGKPADAGRVVFVVSGHFDDETCGLIEQISAIDRTRVKVVAVGPFALPDVILTTIRCGAIDYLHLHGTLPTELKALLGRVDNSHSDKAKTGKLFTILSPVGGTGASLLATNLAVAIAQRHETCALLDLQIRGGDLAGILKVSPRHTLMSLAEKSSQLDRAIFEQALIKHSSGVQLLASPEPFSDYRQIDPQVIEKVVRFARNGFSYVVAEVEDMEHSEQVRTVAASDQVIIPMRLDFIGLNRVKRCLDLMLSAKVPKEHITLVAMRVGQCNELPLRSVAQALGHSIPYGIPDDAENVNASYNLGVPLMMSAPRSSVAEQIAKIADNLLAGGEHYAADCAPARPTAGPKALAYITGLLTFAKLVKP